MLAVLCNCDDNIESILTGVLNCTERTRKFIYYLHLSQMEIRIIPWTPFTSNVSIVFHSIEMRFVLVRYNILLPMAPFTNMD